MKPEDTALEALRCFREMFLAAQPLLDVVEKSLSETKLLIEEGWVRRQFSCETDRYLCLCHRVWPMFTWKRTYPQKRDGQE